VAVGSIDLEALLDEEIDDEEARKRLLELPGVGPYAAAHVMMLIGRHSRLILDSWTRPTYARLNGGRPLKDASIERRFRRYGPYAGLAFWLMLTRDWVAE
jgi:3-methyladenine DNA glycosylase/8-oxoguanine DNA glycosylase